MAVDPQQAPPQGTWQNMPGLFLIAACRSDSINRTYSAQPMQAALRSEQDKALRELPAWKRGHAWMIANRRGQFPR
jgi:hypothetical protein